MDWTPLDWTPLDSTGLHWTWTALKSSWVQMDFSVHSNWTGLGVRSSPVQSSPVYEIWVARLSKWLGPVSLVESGGVHWSPTGVRAERVGEGKELHSFDTLVFFLMIEAYLICFLWTSIYVCFLKRSFHYFLRLWHYIHEGNSLKHLK